MVNTQRNEFVRFHEPLRSTLLRTFSIALIPALITCFVTHHNSMFAPVFFGILWISFGGHWAEIVWLNLIRHRLPKSPLVQKLGRIAFWFVSGMILGVPMGLTIRLFDPKSTSPTMLTIGFTFVLIELLVHYVLLHLRGRPSFYNSAG